MELRQLRYFTTVVGAGSLTAAAAELHLSQPPLSVAIAKLEKEVGVPLLVRSPRGVEPTSAGHYLLDAASRLLGDVDDIVAELRRFGAGLAGTVTLAAVPQLMWHRVPALLRAHARQSPDLEVRLVDPPPWTAVEMVQQRAADLAAVVVADPQRFAARHRGTLAVHDWGPVPLVAALPPEEHGALDPFPLRAFDGAHMLLPRRSPAVPSLPEAVDATFRRHGITPGSVRTVETIQAGLPLVEAGIARAILPDPDRASLARFDVVVRRLDPEPRPLRALVLSRPGASTNPGVAGLLRRVMGEPAE
ncbi:LysR family nitrogen assimilation transcriptional regulator [Promicromonospora sp. AC04]|uniref:LysR family transcriptional regulator n=1 Tax=Promicromonospora sp. AC04 TaxID=2135723 RepID=UPI000D3AB4B0|nr:LysR family transcriptional regulator [Promicromonospora sp. AC04]PUB32306.1 LysR family nitrogen assimilation transcriptional regulator [Promicromonospora sp. AC04]